MANNFTRRFLFIVVALCVVIYGRFGLSTDEEEPALLSTPFGTLVGNQDVDGCDSWLGIPYANPPIGELRFADTVAWDRQYENGRRDAKAPGDFCVQSKRGQGKEDCLYLNVWRPTTTSADVSEKGNLLPIMIFIHGGAFVSGSSLTSLPNVPFVGLNEYNGCNLSREQGVIVASMNYRLGPFGFAAFDDEGEDPGANFGLQDQRVAMQWMKKNADQLGGDPEKITIFGESAGAMSVIAHLASPKSQGLFRAAISQSGYPIALSWSQGLDITRRFARRAGCGAESASSMRSCLRRKSLRLLRRAAGDSLEPLDFLVRTGWRPVVDGSELLQHPYKALSSDDKATYPSVPLLIGTDTDEANLFIFSNYRLGMWFGKFGEWLERFTTQHNAETRFNSTDIEETRNLYKEVEGARNRASSIGTDGSFLCGTQVIAQSYRRSNVFLYRFNHRPSCFSLGLVSPGVYHTVELPFVFDSSDDYFCGFDAVDAAVGLRVRTMWANFAKSLNPSQPGKVPNATVPIFPPYTNGQGLVIQGGGDEVEANYRAPYCAFWQEKIFDKFLANQMGPEWSDEPTTNRAQLQG